MENKLKELRDRVSELSKELEFIHHKWYLKYHLELVEKISLELYEKYESADIHLLKGLVWIHDYAKIIGVKDKKEVLECSKKLLSDIGFEYEYISNVIHLLDIFESKITKDLSVAPLEVRIVSSADAISHMYGPFYQMYCYENPEMSVEELMGSNIRKLEKDWDRKIVLPEVKELFKERHIFLKESFGELSDPIIKNL